MTKKLAKSSILKDKEKQLQRLRQQRKRTLTNLKRNNTLLKNLKAGIVEMQQKVNGQFLYTMMDIQQVKDEMAELFQKIYESETIEETEKEGLDEFIKTLEQANPVMEIFGKTMDELEGVKQQDQAEAEAFNRKKTVDYFESFKIETAEQEKKEIRKIFLRLASKFHPDKAKNKREQNKFHRLMQKINEAYERKDLATLIDISNKYDNGKEINWDEIDEEGLIVDMLDIEIDKFKVELDLMRNQLHRVKTELKSIRTSEIGQAYKQDKNAHKHGAMNTDDLLNALEQQRHLMTQIRESLKEYLEQGEMPDLIRALFVEESNPKDVNLVEPEEVQVELEEIVEVLNVVFE